MVRDGKARGPAAVLPVVGLLAFAGAIIVAAWFGAISTVAAVTLCTGGNVYFGMRMLANRLHNETPRLGRLLVAGTALLALLVGVHLAGVVVSPFVGPGLAALACAV